MRNQRPAPTKAAVPANCDICREPLKGKEAYDAKTIMGPWGWLCDPCFQLYGVGLGIGRGQKYNADGIKVEG